ncbi:AlpA family transcriptional regulator [Altericroceibacterium spongiae]|uniref:AlpA family transcriptional regulator n=2 Tax=Altericroceibacterium spongiae TaxID=2320269 RepID=A0A420ERN5_9SPHN|nr:AlpA family transcriptional regulator [Altericroceibacterium spongiae]RKF23337.1 AlpA family transcriptional regulator [Altericroceibacterium spongiae]
MSDRLLRLPSVVETTGLSRRTIYRKMDCGEFPRSVQISANAVAWRQSDIDRWIENPLEWRGAA